MNARLRAFAAASILVLAGCGAGSSLKPPASTPQSAPQTATVSITVVTRAPSSVARSPRYVAPNAKSVAISVAPGDPQYLPTGACANITSGITTYTLSVPAPVGNDTFNVQTFDGPCNANAGTGHTIGATKAISGTVTAGAANVLNPNGVAPAQPCNGSCTMTIGALYNVAATVFSASLSSSTAGLTAFAIDPGVTMAMPVALTLIDPVGNPLTSPDSNNVPVVLLQPVTITLTDTSLGAVAGSIGLALVNGAGGIYCPQSSGSVQFASTATATCPSNLTTAATSTVAGTTSVSTTFSTAPRSTDKLVVVSNGASQSVFQSATLTATSGSTVIATIPISAQAQTSTFANGGVPIAFPANVTGVAAAPAGGLDFVSAGAQVYPFTQPSTLGGGSNAVAGAALTGITVLAAASTSVYAVDRNCVNCDTSHVGVQELPATAAGVSGQTPVQLSAAAGTTASIDQFGPVGIVALTPAQGGANPNGSLLVASGNAIYRVDLSSTTTISAITLIAGSGSGGSGFADNATGTSALFNFGNATFVGLALNSQGTALLVADAQNAALRQVALTGSNAVTTLAAYPSAPAGLAVDPASGLILTTHPSVGTIEAVAGSGGAPAIFAGKSGTLSSRDGLGLQAYPLQFNAGNNVATAAGGSAAAAYSGLYDPSGTVLLGTNSTQAAQAAAGVATYLATFASPAGIALDAGSLPNARFLVIEAGTKTLRRVL